MTYLSHKALCVSSDNEALGLIDLQYFHNDNFDMSTDSDNRLINEKKGTPQIVDKSCVFIRPVE